MATKKKTDISGDQLIGMIKGEKKIDYLRVMEKHVLILEKLQEMCDGSKEDKAFIAKQLSKMEEMGRQLRDWAFEAFPEEFAVQGTRRVCASNLSTDRVIEQFNFVVYVSKK